MRKHGVNTDPRTGESGHGGGFWGEVKRFVGSRVAGVLCIAAGVVFGLHEAGKVNEIIAHRLYGAMENALGIWDPILSVGVGIATGLFVYALVNGIVGNKG